MPLPGVLTDNVFGKYNSDNKININEKTNNKAEQYYQQLTTTQPTPGDGHIQQEILRLKEENAYLASLIREIAINFSPHLIL